MAYNPSCWFTHFELKIELYLEKCSDSALRFSLWSQTVYPGIFKETLFMKTTDLQNKAKQKVLCNALLITECRSIAKSILNSTFFLGLTEMFFI